MEIKIVLALLILYLLHMYSQVGIDSSAPEITLGGVVKPTQLIVLSRIIVPKIKSEFVTRDSSGYSEKRQRRSIVFLN